MLMQVNMTNEQQETPPCHSWLDEFIYMSILTASRMRRKHCSVAVTAPGVEPELWVTVCEMCCTFSPCPCQIPGLLGLALEAV